MNKKYFAIIFACFFLALAIVSATANKVCCEKTTDGKICQNVQASDCSGNAAQTSCDQTSFCQLGTCVNSSNGECSSNVPKEACKTDGGVWHKEQIDDVPVCKRGCCQAGDQVAFVSNAVCKNLATDYGVDIKFRSDITDEATCLKTAGSEKKSACVFISENSKRCTLETKTDCQNKKGSFYKGVLCTADGLSDCAPTNKKTCHGNNVYFLDSCGNLANVYEKSMAPGKGGLSTSTQRAYWTKIQKPTCELKNKKDCGNCDYIYGTSCRKDGDDYSCKDLSCKYDINGDGKIDNGEILANGESICANAKGVPVVKVDPSTMEYKNGIRKKIEDGYNKYDLPGSRYYKLTCWEGEMITEPCADYRNEICKEGTIETNNKMANGKNEFRIAQCRANTWRECFNITDNNTCENDYLDCKWIPGNRFDGKIVSEDLRGTEQGSCVPLYAPGFDFWNANSSGSQVCALGSTSNVVSYESSWASHRGDIRDSRSKSIKYCFNGCFAIPGYGGDHTKDDLIKMFMGEDNLDSSVTKRAGYYCLSGDGKEETGGIHADKVHCNRLSTITKFSKGENKPLPLFMSNKDWLESITKRAKSLGDCGYKKSSMGKEGISTPEIITRLFQFLHQDETVKKSDSLKTTYIEDKWNGQDKRSNGLNNEDSGSSGHRGGTGNIPINNQHQNNQLTGE